MDILTYIDRVKANYSKQPEPVYNTKKYFMGGSVTKPKRGLVDEPGSYGGRPEAEEALKEKIKNNKPINLRQIAKDVGTSKNTVGRVYAEKFPGEGILGKSPIATKTVNELIEKGITDPAEIKKMAKAKGIVVADRTINRLVNIATDYSISEYEDVFKNMAKDRNYVPPMNLKLASNNINFTAAKQNIQKEIPNIQELININSRRRKDQKAAEARKVDPEKKAKYSATQQKGRDKRRFNLQGNIGLSKSDNILNAQQRTLINTYNNIINENPNSILKDKQLLDKISTRVNKKTGKIYKSNPDLTAVLDTKKDARFFNLSHGRRAELATQLTDAPVNRFVAPFSINNEFIKDAEFFIEKNPNSPEIKNIIKKAEELKITLRPNVPKGTFKNAKGNPVRYVGYTENINDPIEKIRTVLNEYMPKDLKSKVDITNVGEAIETNTPFHTALMDYCDKGKKAGGSAGVCSIEEATDGLKNALTKSKGNPAQMSKFKNILKTGGKYFGWVDAPIELVFALPGLLKGDKDEALRATTLGLFGAGRSELEKLDPKSPAYKTAKGKQDVKDYLKNYFQAQDLEKKLDDPKLDKVNEEYLTNLYNETVDKVDKVKSEYVPFTLQDEVAANKQIRDQEKKEADKGFEQPDGSLATSNYAKDLDLSNAYDYFKYKGDPGYNRNKVAAEELKLDNFYGDFTGKELEDRYGDLPTNIASSVGAAEKKQVDELMRKKLLEKGLDLSDNRISKYGIRMLKGTPNFLGFATGGLANLTTKTAPKKGPQSQGLAYFMKRGRK